MSTIKTIIFDFGDVFINLDKTATKKRLFDLGVTEITDEMLNIALAYEKGEISTNSFIDKFRQMFDHISESEFTNAWNAIILDFPEHRLKFIEQLASEKKFNLILLSNTNELHIDQVKKNMKIERYNRFKSCFNKFYLSYEIHLSKPNPNIFNFVLKENNIISNECLFIDDTKANIDSASRLGLHTWNNNPKTQDIVDLFSIKNELF